MHVSAIAPAELKSLLDRGDPVVIIDLREPSSWLARTIPGSLNVPYEDLVGGRHTVKTVPGSPVVALGWHGARAVEAARVLAKRGLDARALDGGFVGWHRVYDVAEVPVARSRVRVFQVRRVATGTLSYVFENVGEAVVVDPTIDFEILLPLIASLRARLFAVVETRTHDDRVSGAAGLAHSAGVPLHSVRDGTLRAGGRVRFGGAELSAEGAPDGVAFTVEDLVLGRELGMTARGLPRRVDPSIWRAPGVPILELANRAREPPGPWPVEVARALRAINDGSAALDEREQRDVEAGFTTR